MDSILLSDSSRVCEGLHDMLAASGAETMGCDASYVELPIALLYIEVAKRAEDRPEWFPRGKWATIQALQGMVEKQLDALFKEPKP